MILFVFQVTEPYKDSTTDHIHLPMQIYSKDATNIWKNKITDKRPFLPEFYLLKTNN